MDFSNILEILEPEIEVEWAIAEHPEFLTGCEYGEPRRGHPEGKVIYHIADVLKNVEKYSDCSNRVDLRAIAIVHDAFKYKVDRTKPKTGNNHHGYFAREFLDRFISDIRVLEVTELHDEAYLSWCLGGRKGNWERAEKRAIALADRLEESDSIDLYLKFYRCDNETGDKERDNFLWFNQVLRNQGHVI